MSNRDQEVTTALAATRHQLLGRVRAGLESIPISQGGVIVGRLRAVRPDDAEAVAAWRESNRNWFLTEFPYDPPRTRGWINSLLSRDDRLLLIVVHENGEAIGHVGLTTIDLSERSAEIDNVVRGSTRGGRMGLMASAVEALIAWATNSLGLSRFRLRVFAENPAVAFYRRLGFESLRSRTALAFEREGNEGRWLPSAGSAERYLLTMVLPARSLDGIAGARSRKVDR